MKKTRFLALFLCLVMLIGILPPQTRAADEVLYLQWDYKLSVDNLFKLHPIHLDLVLNLTTGKATLDFKRLEEPQYSGYIQEKEKEKEYTKKYKENMSGHVTYDIVLLDLKTGDPRLPACLRNDATMKDGVKWLLTNASGAESVIWDIANDPEHTLLCPYEIWLSPYRDDPNSNFLGQFHSRKFITDPEDSRYIACGSYFKLADGAPPSEPAKREYTMGRDNFGFKNSTGAFFYTAQGPVIPRIYRGTSFANGTRGFLIDESAYNTLIRARTPSQIARLNTDLSGEWSGACYGMSVMSGLLFNEKLSLAQYGGAADAFNLKEPSMNEPLARVIMYYHLRNYLEHRAYRALHPMDLASSKKNALDIVKSLQNDPESPVVVSFNFDTTRSDGSAFYGGHAVLAFKLEKDTSGLAEYIVSVYDPNKPDGARELYIESDGTASIIHYGMLKVWPCAKATALYDSSFNYPAIPAGTPLVTVNGDVTVETNDKSATVQNGTVTGDLPVTVYQPEVESDETVIVIPVGDKPVRIRRLHPNNGGSASVQTSDAFALITGGVSEVTVNPDGSVTAKTNGSEGTLAVASDTTKGDLFGTTVATKAGEITITPTANGAKVTTSDGTADITVSGATQSVGFEDVDTSKGVDIQSSGSSTTLTSGGQEIAKGTATANGGKAEAAQPLQPAADKQQISNNASQKARNNSSQIVGSRRNSGDVVNAFHSRRNARYSSWAEEELALADDLRLIPDALFNKLQGNITRREFAQLVYNTVKAATGMSDADMAKYASMPNNAYASQFSDPAVAFAYGVGIVSGYEDGSFRPDNTITREQAAKMLVVMAELLGKITSESGAKNFNDAPNNWAQTYINKISSVTSPYSGARVMGGDDKGNFSPNGTFTTEQAVATMLRMFESVVGEKSNYSGGAVQSTTTPTTPTQTGTTVPTVADNDMTGYTPKDWSWTAEGEGYGRKYFTSGKYVRRDGLAVIYIESSDSPDGFSYTLFVPASGARQSNYESHDQYGNSFAWAAVNEWNEYHANDRGNGLIFDSIGDGRLEIVSDWIDEMYLQYEAPDGTYYLVREKK